MFRRHLGSGNTKLGLQQSFLARKELPSFKELPYAKDQNINDKVFCSAIRGHCAIVETRRGESHTSTQKPSCPRTQAEAFLLDRKTLKSVVIKE